MMETESPQEALDRISKVAIEEIYGGPGNYTEDDWAKVAESLKPSVARAFNYSISDFSWPPNPKVD